MPSDLIRIHETNIERIEQYFNTALSKLGDLSKEELVEFFHMMQRVGSKAWKMECAIIYELVRRFGEVEHINDAFKAVSEMISRTENYVKSRYRIWEIFFQDPNSNETKEREHEPYLLEERTDGWRWFDLARHSEDPIAMMKEIERRMIEYRQLGSDYTLKQARKEFSQIVGSKRKPKREKTHFDKVINSDRRIRDAASRMITIRELLFDIEEPLIEQIVYDLDLLMMELRLITGEVSPADVRSALQRSRIDHSHVIEAYLKDVERDVQRDETGEGEEVDDEFL